MDVKELNLEELQHEHPLILVDLQLMHRDYNEDDDDYDDNDLIATQNFECICNRCDRRIDWYHRYYYKCNISSCNYTIHKFCEEMPKTIKFQGHPSHTLILKRTSNDQLTCHGCFRHNRDGICYHCSLCNYGIDLLCATFVEHNTIHHPSHLHPLIFLSVEPGLNKCFACGKKHEGYFYQCITCFNFLINSECLSLPMKLLLQTQQFSHRHLLTLSYSFLDRLYDFECRICGMKFEDEHLIYKCSKCMYYVHPDCATQRMEPFMSILSIGLGKTKKNYKDADHLNLLHFPLDDGSHILSHQTETENSQYIFHRHPTALVISEKIALVHGIINVSTGINLRMKSISLHDPMKRIKQLCTGCIRPVTEMPFYKCTRFDDGYGCDFTLHDWCNRLPNELKNFVGHRLHTLKLNNIPSISGFKCRICGLPCNGFSYCCKICGYFIDVNCAFIPEEITHEAHANHLLSRVYGSSSRLSTIECRACRVSIGKNEVYFRCSDCDFYLDCRCALHLPKTIRHKFDKHPLELSYEPIEDHKSEYFCEICEDGLDPGKWFYHCVECAQSIHSACAPLILQSEQGVNSLYVDGLYKFINIKFGGVKRHYFHRHPVSFASGTENDGSCATCGGKLQSSMIWKCLHCNFARHYHNCKHQEPVRSNARLFVQISDNYKKPAPLDYLRKYGEFWENIPKLSDSYWGNKRVIKYRPQINLEFYPSEMIRPVTRDWKVVEDVQQ